MTASGKSLKDIYDAGTEKLLDLEKQCGAQLKDSAQDLSQSRQNNEQGATQRVETRTLELEQELRSFMAASVERLQKVLDAEIKETADHLKSVKSDLSTLSERLRGSIVELRKTYEENVDTLCGSLADGYEGAVEASTMELEKQDFASSKHLRAHGTVVTNSLQQKLDHSLWESRGEEKLYNSALFKAFMQKANSIDTHFSTLMQRLSADFQGHFKVVENQSLQADPELQRVTQQLTSEIGGYAAQMDSDVKQLYQNLLDEHSKQLDNNLNSVAQDLSSVHDSTTERLTEQTRELSESFVTASGEARILLTDRCTKLRTQFETLSQKFGSRLEEKMENSKNLRSALETEKTGIFEQVRKDLEEIRDSFESRLKALLAESTAKVSNIAAETEKEITDVYKRCDDEIKHDGTASKAQIDKSIAEFVRLLAEHRANALDLIAKSAGSVGDSASVTPPSPIQPPPTNFDFPDDLDF